MEVRARGFQIQKRGYKPEQCEDAHAIGAGAGRYAVADGAGTTSWSREWAQLLVEAATSDNETLDLTEARAAWKAALPWEQMDSWARRKAEQGAAATLVTLELKDADASAGGLTAWKISGVGDACAFVVRHDRLIYASLRSAEDFSGMTEAISSIDSGHSLVAKNTGLVQPGDLFVLASDAIGQQIHRLLAARKMNWWFIRWLGLVDEASANTRFASWVESLRSAPDADWQMHNDDTTLLVVDTAPAPTGPVWYPAAHGSMHRAADTQVPAMRVDDSSTLEPSAAAAGSVTAVPAGGTATFAPPGADGRGGEEALTAASDGLSVGHETAESSAVPMDGLRDASVQSSASGSDAAGGPESIAERDATTRMRIEAISDTAEGLRPSSAAVAVDVVGEVGGDQSPLQGNVEEPVGQAPAQHDRPKRRFGPLKW